MSIIENWKDLDVTVVVEVEDYCVSFKIYEVIGWTQGASGEWDVPDYQRDDAKDCGDWTDSVDDAELFMRGFVKWDGCSNWSFDSTQKCMYHACGRPGLTRIGEVMARCWDWTARTLPTWDKTLTVEQRA